MPGTTTETSVKEPCIEDVLSSKAVSFQELEKNYKPLLMMVRAIIGVVPNCDKSLEIFPPAFITYNLIVPNCLNLPHLLLGWAAPSNLIGLALYYASKSYNCSYCMMHTCNFAMRRGVQTEVLKKTGELTSAESAVINFASNLSSSPPTLTQHDREALNAELTPANVEWVFLGATMMGYLAPFMASLGVSMEKDAVEEGQEVLHADGWTEGKHKIAPPEAEFQRIIGTPPKSDGWLSTIALIRYIPFCIRYDSNHTAKIPSTWPLIEEFLQNNIGHGFPVIGNLTHSRALRGVAEIIRRNLDSEVCGIDIGWKKLIGILYGSVHGNVMMKNGFKEAIEKLSPDSKEFINVVEAFGEEETDFNIEYETSIENSVLKSSNLPEDLIRILFIAKAGALVPARTTRIVVDLTRAMEASDIVELINWVSVLSFLQKFYIYYCPNYGEEQE